MSLILTIDDDENLLKVIEKQLNTYNYQVITALSGLKGIELAKIGNPDLILLDLMMPDMDGFAVLKQLQKDNLTKNLPVIMLTSKKSKEDVVNAMRMGVSDYVIKPHKIDILHQKIQTAIKYREISEEAKRAEESQFIEVARKKKRTVVSFKSAISDKRVLEDMKSVFTRGFLNLTAKDVFIIDLRNLTDLNEGEAKIIEKMTNIFSDRDVSIIAGRHYGILMAECNFRPSVELYISPGDLELAVLKKETEE